MIKESCHIEIEDKFVLEKPIEKDCWEKTVLVYQFFEKCKDRYIVQDKIVINVTKGTCSFCTVRKEAISANKSIKDVEYHSINDINIYSYLNKQFVLKKRQISGNLFYDTYVYGNYPIGITQLWMLEIEYNENESLMKYSDILEYAKCVSDNPLFYNEHMTVTFNKEHLKEIDFLLRIFRD